MGKWFDMMNLIIKIKRFFWWDIQLSNGEIGIVIELI